MTKEEDIVYTIIEQWGNAAHTMDMKEELLISYAKQQAIAFNNYVETTHTGNCIIGYYDRNSEDGTRLTIEHVYNQFIEQQTKDK